MIMNRQIVKLHTKVILLGIFTVALIGCQSQIAKTGQAHKLAVDKWQALANYATSELVNHDVTITARLQLSQEGRRVGHNLVDIKLSAVEHMDEINMLSPQFLMKYACHTQCARLAEYVPAPFMLEHSLLINYFSDYEFELFRFYADIMLLNERINHLSNLNPELVSVYLQAIVNHNIDFDSLSEFSNFLNFMLSTDQLAMFVENKNIRLGDTPWNSKINNRWKQLAVTPDVLWQDIAAAAATAAANLGLVTAPTADYLWQLDTQQPNDTWQALTKDEELFGTPDVPLTASRTNDWDIARQNDYNVGDSICSYSDNIFGVVSSINANSVSITAIGQVKLISDGIVSDREQGILFVLEEDIYFAPLDEVRTFDKGDLAVCEVEIY